MSKILVLLCLGLLSLSSWARGLYQSSDDFLAEVFANQVPKSQVIWLSGNKRQVASEILQHKPDRLRIRYWANDEQSAWVMNEIGKEQPITVGIFIQSGEIKLLRVLEFRESRGDEVRHPFFTKQFNGSRLEDNFKLNQSIDGITGATLSVRALKRLARLALYLDQQRQL